LMTTAFNDSAFLHDDNFVSVSDSAESMSDHYDIELSALNEFIQGLLHLKFRLCVER